MKLATLLGLEHVMELKRGLTKWGKNCMADAKCVVRGKSFSSASVVRSEGYMEYGDDATEKYDVLEHNQHH